MKFLCIECDQIMAFAERQLPGDGTMAAVFACPKCGREIAMLTNPMETQMVSGLGVKVGGETVPAEPLELTLASVQGASANGLRVEWDGAARERLENVPSFVRGMVKRIYTDWAREHGITTITPVVMDQARSDLGLEGM